MKKSVSKLVLWLENRKPPIARPAIKQHGVKVAIRRISLSDWGKLGDEECFVLLHLEQRGSEGGRGALGGRTGKAERGEGMVRMGRDARRVEEGEEARKNRSAGKERKKGRI